MNTALLAPIGARSGPAVTRSGDGVAPVTGARADPAPFRTLPGGALVSERWSAPDRVLVSVCGEVDGFDRHALVDLLTGCVLDGARHVVVDARVVPFADVAVLRGIDQARRHLARAQGSLQVLGLNHLENAVRSIAVAGTSIT